MVFFRSRNTKTNANDKNCERMVASAAPATPMPKVYINSGSSPTFASAPITVVHMPIPE